MTNSELFQTFRSLFYYSGIWKDKPTFSFLIYGHFLHIGFLIIWLAFVLDTSKAFSEGKTALAFNFGAVLNLGVTLIKLRLSKTKDFQLFIDGIFKKEEYIYSTTETEISEKYSQFRKGPIALTKLYNFTMISTLAVVYCVTISLVLKYKESPGKDINYDKPLLMPIWTPFDQYVHYIWANIFYALVSTIGGPISIAVDFVVLCPIIYLILRYRMLKHILMNSEQFVETQEKNWKGDEHFRVVVQCVVEYQQIIEEVQKFKSMIKHVLFFDFCFHSIQIAAFVIALLTSEQVITIENMVSLSCVNYIFFQLLIIYWHGQVLIDEGESIPTAIYQSNWYEADAKSKQFLLMIMMRSQKPLGLNIGPFGMADLIIFQQILKLIYSIITVIIKA